MICFLIYRDDYSIKFEIEIYQNILESKNMTSIKIVCGDEEKIIDVDIKMLKTLDRDYFACITSDKFKKEEYIEYGLDEKYESIEGFIRFFDDYCKYNKEPKLFHIKSQLDIQVLQTAYRFNKLDMYIFKLQVYIQNKYEYKTYIDPYVIVKYSSEPMLKSIIYHPYILIRYSNNKEEKRIVEHFYQHHNILRQMSWENLTIKEGFKCFDLLPYQIKRIIRQKTIDIDLCEGEIYRLDTFQYCNELRIIYGYNKWKIIGYSIIVKFIELEYKVTIKLHWKESDYEHDYCHFGYGEDAKAKFTTIINTDEHSFILDHFQKEMTFSLDKSYKFIEICKDQILKFD